MPQRRKLVRRTESQWTKILSDFTASDLSPKEFCSIKNLSLASFQRWRRRVGTITSAKFVELHPSTVADSKIKPAGAWSLDVTLPNGVSLRFQG